MDCATFKDLVALYALGGLERDERIACETHLKTATHEGCREALSRATATVASMDDATGEAPPPRVWEAIERQIAPEVNRRRSVHRRVWWAAGTALACAAALVLALIRLSQLEATLGDSRNALANRDQVFTSMVGERDACLDKLQRLEGTERLRAEAVDLLQLGGTTLFPLAAKNGRNATANAIMHTGVKRAYVVAEGLPSVPDRDYEMWIAKGKRVVPAGLIKVDARGRAVVRIDYATLLGEVGAPDAMMITLEPRGGSAVVQGPTILLGTPRG
jgi:anti-sigma-K factor RskA